MIFVQHQRHLFVFVARHETMRYHWQPLPRIFQLSFFGVYQARALRALGLLLADGTPTGGRGEDFLMGQLDFFTETAVTSERKVEKSFPRWEINRHDKG